MTSPDLMHELRASRPIAPTTLRARVREISAQETGRAPWSRFHFPVRRVSLIAIPAAATLAFASAGVLGIAKSDVSPEAYRQESLEAAKADESAPATNLGVPGQTVPGQALDSAIGPQLPAR